MKNCTSFGPLSLVIVLLLPGEVSAQQRQGAVSPLADAEPSAPLPGDTIQGVDAGVAGDHDGVAGDHDGVAGDPDGMGGGHDGMGGGQHGHRVDFQPPASVILAHVHPQGDWIVGYRYSNVYMSGNQTGTTPLTTQQALDFLGPVPPGIPGVNTFKMAPISMTMEMHMMPIMCAITDDVTLCLMPTWLDNTMDMVGRNGVIVRSTNGGFSDLPFGALWRIYQGCSDEVVLNIGLSAPTGDIDNINPLARRDGNAVPLHDASGPRNLGCSPRRYLPIFLGPRQHRAPRSVRPANGIQRRPVPGGRRIPRTGWFAYLLDAEKRLALTYRVEGLWRTDYVGADPRLNPYSMSGADANMRGGEYLNFGYGVMCRLPGRLGLIEGEYVHPIVQNLNGVQGTTVGSFAVRYLKTF